MKLKRVRLRTETTHRFAPRQRYAAVSEPRLGYENHDDVPHKGEPVPLEESSRLHRFVSAFGRLFGRKGAG